MKENQETHTTIWHESLQPQNLSKVLLLKNV